MALNIHNIIGDALTVVNDWKTFTFTKTTQEWVVGKLVPETTTEVIELKGKLQPASSNDIMQLGVNFIDKQYFKIYVTGTPTQLDRARQLQSDIFECEGFKYRVVGKFPWDDGGWRKAFCYLDEKVEETTPTDPTDPTDPTG